MAVTPLRRNPDQEDRTMTQYEIQQDNANKWRVIRTGADGVRRAWDNPPCETREEAEAAIREFQAEDADSD